MEGHVLEDEADLMGHRLDERELGLDERHRVQRPERARA